MNPLGRPVDKLNEGAKAPAAGNVTGGDKVEKKAVLKIAGFKVRRAKRAFVLSWKKVKDAKAYEIIYRQKGNKNFKKLKTVKTCRVKTKKLRKNKYYYLYSEC